MAVTHMDDYRQESPAPASGGGGGGNDLDVRLRAVETRLARIEAEMKHMATKAWVLAGVLGGMGVAAGIAVGIGVMLVKLL